MKKAQVTYTGFEWECPYCDYLNIHPGDSFPITDGDKHDCDDCGKEVSLYE